MMARVNPFFRSLLPYAACALFTLLMAAGVFTWNDRQMRAHVLTDFKSAAKALSVESIQLLRHGSNALTINEYEQLETALEQIREQQQFKYVYLFGKRICPDDPLDSQVIFLIDVQDDLIESQPPLPWGTPYHESTDRMLSLFTGGTPYVEGPEEDQWGVWVSPLLPLANPVSGEVIALLGGDFAAGSWYWQVAARSAGSVLLIGLMAIAIMAWIYSKSTHSKPITEGIFRRLMLPMATIIVLLAALFALATLHLFKQNLQDSILKSDRLVQHNLRHTLELHGEGLDKALRLLAQRPRFGRVTTGRGI
jgi:hypothetical protein